MSFFIFLKFFKIFRFSLAQLFLCVYNCLQKAKGSSRAKRAESRMHLLDPEPDLGNANVGRYDMHIFCRYTSTYICFLISMNTSSTGSSSTTREFASAKILTQEEQKIMLGTCLDNVRKTTPLVHNITNYVTVNDVANILLACGASPIMSDEPEDVEDITSICGGLNINIGTLHRTSIDGMYRAGAKAASLGHKILLDPVGAGASHLRTSTAVGLMEKIPFTVIRGNISEIKTLALGSGTTKGVDADVADKVTDENLDSAVAFAKNFAKDHNCVVAITGAIDLVADADTCYVIRNGRAEMGSITGTGCQLSGMMTAYLVANPDEPLKAAAAAVCAMGLAGEIGWSHMKPEDGNSTYRNRIIDAIYHMDGETLEKGAKYEVR